MKSKDVFATRQTVFNLHKLHLTNLPQFLLRSLQHIPFPFKVLIKQHLTSSTVCNRSGDMSVHSQHAVQLMDKCWMLGCPLVKWNQYYRPEPCIVRAPGCNYYCHPSESTVIILGMIWQGFRYIRDWWLIIELVLHIILFTS